jgi:signal transduction histidine kinase
MNAIVVFVVFMVFMVFVVGRHVGRVIAIIIFMQRHVLQILDLGMNVAHFIADELHLMFVTVHMAIIAQFREGCDFFIFLFQYLSAHFFVFAKKRAQPCVASRGVANARRVLEQFFPYFVPSWHAGNVLHVVQRNSATVARLMVAHGLSRIYVLYKMSDIKYIKDNAHNTNNHNHRWKKTRDETLHP